MTALELFDVLGRRVEVEDIGTRSGHVTVPWHGSRLASGLYFARLDAKRGTEKKHWVTRVVWVR